MQIKGVKQGQDTVGERAPRNQPIYAHHTTVSGTHSLWFFYFQLFYFKLFYFKLYERWKREIVHT
jgi:hypothetical protein